jgi:agmatine/peptidylarginine deiminase
MKSRILLGLLFLLAFLPVIRAQYTEPGHGYILTHEMTPEEMLIRDQIGRDFTPTEPPEAPVRMVAEFEEMQAVLVRYPFGIPIALIKEMTEDCRVVTIVASGAEQTAVTNQYQNNGVNLANCDFLIAPTNSYWTRDYGPWFVVDGNNTVGVSDFPYNRPRPQDDEIPVFIADYYDEPLYGMDLIHTGGNYMCDGLGIAASTDLVIEENPSLTEDEIDTLVWHYLGVHKYYKLPDPLGDYIKHIDCWGKFLDVDKVLIGQVLPSDPRYADYEYVANYFAMQTSSWGNNFQVYRVYTPGNTQKTPYTNSLILNKKVFLPISGNQNDDEAILAYQQAMPGYEIIGINYSGWENTDALHCRAIGIADKGMLFVKHMPLLGTKAFRMQWDLPAEIIPYSGTGVVYDSTRVYYKVGEGDYQSVPLSHGSGYNYTATLPFILPGNQVSYYLKAKDYSNRTKFHPYIGAPDPHVFTVNYATAPVTSPDTLVFDDMEDMFEGLSFDLYNFTNGNLVINEMENEGFGWFHWYIDPWTTSLPDTMAFSDTLTYTVKVTIPVSIPAGYWVMDTLDIVTDKGLKQVFLKIDSDLLSGISDRQPSPIAMIEGIYPNPVSDQVKIMVNMKEETGVRISVYSIDGRELAVVSDGSLARGEHEIRWSVKENGRQLPAGIYILRLVTEQGSISRKLIVTR